MKHECKKKWQYSWPEYSFNNINNLIYCHFCCLYRNFLYICVYSIQLWWWYFLIQFINYVFFVSQIIFSDWCCSNTFQKLKLCKMEMTYDLLVSIILIHRKRIVYLFQSLSIEFFVLIIVICHVFYWKIIFFSSEDGLNH